MEQRDQANINSTTVYVQLSGDSGTWRPVIDASTHKPLVVTAAVIIIIIIIYSFI